MSSSAERLEAAAGALRAGQVVVMPTDTVYGVAVDPTRAGATERLFALKRRPPEVALPVLVADVEQARALAGDLPSPARALMERFWPGGLTIVVARRAGLDLALGGTDDGTIALRLPDHPVPVALVRAVGPLAVTSANLHGRPTPPTAAQVLDDLGPGVAVALDAGPCAGAASTVVVCTGGQVRVVREGRVPAGEALAVAGGPRFSPPGSDETDP